MTDIGPDYHFVLRNLATGEWKGELHPRETMIEWERRDTGAGTFSFIVPRNSTYTKDLLSKHTLLQIFRDGEPEFVGVILTRRVREGGTYWQLHGHSLLAFFLSQRVVGAIDPDDRSGTAEDVIKGYVGDHLGNGASTDRKMQSYLGGTTFTVEATAHRGNSVVIGGQRRNLLGVTEEIVRAGDILQDLVVLHNTEYCYRVLTPTNATIEAGAIPFSVNWDNVEELEFIENWDEYRNYIYVAGPGSGSTREISEVYEPETIFYEFRREATLDARYATTAEQRQWAGNLDLQRRRQAVTSVATAHPARNAPGSVYRVDWDVGWDVTFGEDELVDPINVRIAAAKIKLSPNAHSGEDITFDLGTYRPTSSMRKLADAIARLQVASNG